MDSFPFFTQPILSSLSQLSSDCDNASFATVETDIDSCKKRLASESAEAVELWNKIEADYRRLKKLCTSIATTKKLCPPLSSLHCEKELLLDSSLQRNENRGEYKELECDHEERNENRKEGDEHTSLTTQEERKNNRYTNVYSSRYGRSRRNEEKLVSIKKTPKAGRYQGSERSNQLMGSAMAMIPKTGFSGFSTALPIAVAGVLENIGLNVDENIVNCLPGKDSVNACVLERAIDSIMLVRESI